MSDKPDKMPVLGQLPHTGMDEAQIAAQWRELVQDVYAQALVRQLGQDEIEALIPQDLLPYFNIVEHSEGWLVRIMRKREGIEVLQAICDCDCETLRKKHKKSKQP